MRHWLRSKSLVGHTDTVSALSITPDERLVASASLDGSVRIWDRKSGECLRSLTAETDYQRVCFLNGGALITSASSQRCCIWSVASGAVLKAFSAERLSIAAGESAIAIGTELGEVTVFDAKAAKVLGTVKCVEGSIHSLAFLPGTEGVVVAGRGTLARIDIPAMKPAWTVVGHKVEILISRILIDKVSNLVISCSHDGTARVWEVGTGKKVAILRHSGGVSGAAISPDGKSLFTHGAENRLWDTNSWTVRKDLPDGEGHIVKSKFSPDGQCVLAIGTDRSEE